ncbi:MAG: efflux RND transporter periplasmic adaptor subunit [bacterium]|nr:efflux RND transporter periplasmic adaptor subunit [bacterium]
MTQKKLWRKSNLFVVVFALTGLCLACGGDKTGGEAQTTAGTDSTKTASSKVDSSKVDSASAKTAEKNKKSPKAPEGVPVKVNAVEQGEISSYLLFSATVEAEESVDIYAQATGLVEEVLAEEGDNIKKGQVLVTLADDDLKLSEAEARVAYQKLESTFERQKEMFSRKLLSKENFERDRFDLEQTRIRWERAKLALAHASVKSPVNGVVAERLVKLGDRISPTGKLFSLVNMRNLIAYVHIPGRELRTLTVGQPAVVTTDFIPDTTFSARILRISPVVDPGSGTFKITLTLDNKDGQLRPGMFVNTHIVTATHDQAILVPKRAVVYDDGLPHVFVVQDSTANKVRLEVGFEDGQNLEVLSGIKHGDRIVIVGQNGLKDNAHIRIIEGEGLRIPSKPDSTVQQAS